MKKIIEPSLLALDQFDPISELKEIKRLGLKYVHYDVMDEEFIGHRSFTTEHLGWLKTNNIYATVHLMVAHPMEWIPTYQQFLVNAITFHCETQSIEQSKQMLEEIHKYGIKAGLAVKMSTDLSKYESLAKDCDFVTVMSVEPGYGGQEFNPRCLNNLKVCKKWKKINKNLTVQIDGGINDKTMKIVRPYVDNFITGSWFFKNIEKMPTIIKRLNGTKS